MISATDLLGWGSSVVLLATLIRQVYMEWRTGATAGLSKWLFIGQCTASVGYTDRRRARRVRSATPRRRAIPVAPGARRTRSSGHFVFFETGIPHAEFAAALAAAGVAIGKAFPPFDRWARISIGLPRENDIARGAVRKVLRGS